VAEDPTNLGPSPFAESDGSGKQTVDINDLVTKMTRITQEFQYPVELME
jgi:hypothetical protein